MVISKVMELVVIDVTTALTYNVVAKAKAMALNAEVVQTILATGVVVSAAETVTMVSMIIHLQRMGFANIVEALGAPIVTGRESKEKMVSASGVTELDARTATRNSTPISVDSAMELAVSTAVLDCLKVHLKPK